MKNKLLVGLLILFVYILSISIFEMGKDGSLEDSESIYSDQESTFNG